MSVLLSAHGVSLLGWRGDFFPVSFLRNSSFHGFTWDDVGACAIPESSRTVKEASDDFFDGISGHILDSETLCNLINAILHGSCPTHGDDVCGTLGSPAGRDEGASGPCVIREGDPTPSEWRGAAGHDATHPCVGEDASPFSELDVVVLWTTLGVTGSGAKRSSG